MAVGKHSAVEPETTFYDTGFMTRRAAGVGGTSRNGAPRFLEDLLRSCKKREPFAFNICWVWTRVVFSSTCSDDRVLTVESAAAILAVICMYTYNK